LKNILRKGKTKAKRRVPVTALIAWPTFIFEMEERSPIRWQHRLKREHPTCTERKSLIESADGRVATVATRPERKPCPTKTKTNSLDSDRPSHGRRLRSCSRALIAKVRLAMAGNCSRASAL